MRLKQANCRRYFASALLLIGSVLPLHKTVAKDNQPLIVSNVTIVDVVNNRLKPNHDVVVRGERIVAILPGGTVPFLKRGRVLSGNGKFLMSGLWDFHVHLFSAPGEEDFALPLYILNGVTGVRDAGALRTLPAQQQIAKSILSRERVGPRLVLAGALIDGPPGSWPEQMVAANPQEGRQRVREAKDLGWAFIKSYSLLNEPTYRAIADEAKRNKLVLYGHIPESVPLGTAVQAGHRSIEHFGRVTQACALDENVMISANAQALTAAEPMAALMKTMMGHNQRTLETWDSTRCTAVFQQLVKAKVAIMPSLMVSDFYLGKDPAPDDFRLRSIPVAVREQWGKGDWRRQQIPPELLAQAPKSVALDWKTFKLAHSAGVTFLSGTDASFANPFLFHGFTLHDELQRYVEAGLTAQQALMTSVVNPGRFLKRRDLSGRVGVGQKADLVLLDANPLLDIAATRRIHAVVANGRLFDRLALDALRHETEQRAARW
jgi:cytosine/adenosine deaminase-related metal-dependent hydrolase